MSGAWSAQAPNHLWDMAWTSPSSQGQLSGSRFPLLGQLVSGLIFSIADTKVEMFW